MHYGKKTYPGALPVGAKRGRKQTRPEEPPPGPQRPARLKIQKHLFEDARPQWARLNQDGLDYIETCIRTGTKVATIFNQLGITRGTWQNMKARQPEIQETLDRARRGAFRVKKNPAQFGLCAIDPATLAPVGLTPAGMQAIERLAAAGCNHRTIASTLGLTASTYKELKEREPEIQLAFDRGLAKLDEVISGELLKQAKHNTIAAIWIDKSRLGRSEQDVQKAPTTNVQIVLNEALTEEQWKLKALAEASTPATVETTAEEVP